MDGDVSFHSKTRVFIENGRVENEQLNLVDKKDKRERN
jgi:hypothetical protein